MKIESDNYVHDGFTKELSAETLGRLAGDISIVAASLSVWFKNDSVTEQSLLLIADRWRPYR